MIKLKALICEAPPSATAEKAAEYFIRQAWKFMEKDDYFDEYEVKLWLDNDETLSKEMWDVATKLFPNSEDPMDDFVPIIDKKVEDLEDKSRNRMIKRIDSNDPLYVLKDICRGKSLKKAKLELAKSSLGGWAVNNKIPITDENLEEVFSRMYKNAMGETYYNIKSTDDRYGKLSDMKRSSYSGANNDNVREYSINLFLDQYAGYNTEQFPTQVKVFRGVNTPLAKIRPGDYVTFDKRYAMSYVRGKYGNVVSDILNAKDLYVDKIEPGASELVYWPEGHQINTYKGEVPTFKEFWHTVNYEGF